MTPIADYPQPRHPFREGAVVTFPVLIASLPFAIVCGVTASAVGLDLLTGQGVSFFMYAGASQIVLLQLFNAGAPAVVIVGSAVIVNLRYFMYSASLAPHYRTIALGWKLLLAHLTTDQGLAIMLVRFNASWDNRAKILFSLGSGLTMWGSWQMGTLVGLLAGAALPPEWSLDFAIPLTFLALAVPSLRDGAAVCAFFAAGIVAVAAFALPLNLGLLTASIAGVVAGMFVQARA